jgi:hypothetical protein
MARHLYVYYKVSPEQLPKALAASHQLQLAAHSRCKQASVRIRPRTGDEPATVMEVYESVFSNFYMPLWLPDKENTLLSIERHAEWFEDA